jgi:hypothetical protein
MYRISHPEHGSMHVYSESDLELHKEIGWAEDKPVKPTAIPVENKEVKEEVKAPLLSRKK